MPQTIEDLVVKMKDISEELHNKLSQLLHFNGSIRRYLVSDMSVEARFYQISETLMHSKVLLDVSIVLFCKIGEYFNIYLFQS